MLSITVTGAVI